MPTVTYYKNVDPNQTDLTIPEKIKGRYFAYLSNGHVPLFIQTPTLTVQSIGKNSVRFAIKPEGRFETTLKTFDKVLIDYIAQRTVQFFRGFQFSKTKIESSYTPTVHSEGYIDVHIPDCEKLLIKDQRDCIRSIDDIVPGTEAIAILNVEGVAFTKRTITLSLTLHQLKIYVKDQLTDWCILHDSDSEVEGPDPEEAEELSRAFSMPVEKTIAIVDLNTEGKSSETVPEGKESKEETVSPVSSIEQIQPGNDDEKDLF